MLPIRLSNDERLRLALLAKMATFPCILASGALSLSTAEKMAWRENLFAKSSFGVLLQLGTQAIVEEDDLNHGERADVGEAGVVSGYLKNHLAIRVSGAGELHVSAVAHDSIGYSSAKKRVMILTQALQSLE
jgi:hypothetical protein